MCCSTSEGPLNYQDPLLPTETVEHILIHCAEYFHVRIQCFDVDNLRELFYTVSLDTILGFIQRARLYLI